MQRPVIGDLIDWRGCEAVQFDPEKLSGKATVGASRMDADGVLINFEAGLTVDEIVDSFGVPKDAVEKFLAFAAAKQMRRRLEGHAGPQHAGSACPDAEEGEVLSAKPMVFDVLRDGDLLRVAEDSVFDPMVTADRGILYQQNNRRRKIALVAVSTNDRKAVLRVAEAKRAALLRSRPASYEAIDAGPAGPPRSRR